jgi:cytochrome b6-f complex iron-sulfur subunit
VAQLLPFTWQTLTVEVRTMADSPAGGPIDEPQNRRQFFGILSRAFLGLWGLGLAGATALYLKPPGGSDDVAERIIHAGKLEDLRIGEGKLVRHGLHPFYVVRLDHDQVVALSAVCTHVRCILKYDRERRGFICPCHAGRFDLAGNVLGGPPSRALATYSVSVRAGEVYVTL